MKTLRTLSRALLATAASVLMTPPSADAGSPYDIRPSDEDLRAYYDYDSTAPLDGASEVVYEDGLQTAHEVSFINTRDQRIYGMLWIPKQTQAPPPVILHTPGYGDDRNELDATTAPLLGGYYLRDIQYAILIIDPPFRGERGVPGHDVFSLDMVDSRDVVSQYVLDCRRGLDYLETREDLFPEFHVTSLSFGGFSGTILTAVDERIHALSVIIGGGDWPVMIRRSYFPTALALRRALNDHTEAYGPYFQFHDSASYAHMISPRPIHVHSGLLDPIVPTGDNLFRSAAKPKKHYWYLTGHYTAIIASPLMLLRTHNLFDRN